MVLKRETEPLAVIKTGQGAEARPCPVRKPVIGPVIRLKTLF